MLDDATIIEIMSSTMAKYKKETGRPGIAKDDVIAEVKNRHGDVSDVKKIMVEAAFEIIRQIPDIRVLYE